jgi:hypothetical protein
MFKSRHVVSSCQETKGYCKNSLVRDATIDTNMILGKYLEDKGHVPQRGIRLEILTNEVELRVVGDRNVEQLLALVETRHEGLGRAQLLEQVLLLSGVPASV